MSKENKESKEDKAVETIIKHKANKIKNRKGYKNHIETVLDDHHIEVSKEAVEVFLMGAVDAMIFDVGAALNISVWKSLNRRKEMLGKIFPKK